MRWGNISISITGANQCNFYSVSYQISVACQSIVQKSSVTHGRTFLAFLRTIGYAFLAYVSFFTHVFQPIDGIKYKNYIYAYRASHPMCISMYFLFQILSHFVRFYLGGSRANDLHTFKKIRCGLHKFKKIRCGSPSTHRTGVYSQRCVPLNSDSLYYSPKLACW